jgi:membrane associated rhomboid family serine protease
MKQTWRNMQNTLHALGLMFGAVIGRTFPRSHRKTKIKESKQKYRII